MSYIKELTPADFGRYYDPQAFSKYVKSIKRLRTSLLMLLGVVAAGGIVSLVFFLIGNPQSARVPAGVWVDVIWLGMIVLGLIDGLFFLGMMAAKRNSLGITSEQARSAIAVSKARTQGKPVPPSAIMQPGPPMMNAVSPGTTHQSASYGGARQVAPTVPRPFSNTPPVQRTASYAPAPQGTAVQPRPVVQPTAPVPGPYAAAAAQQPTAVLPAGACVKCNAPLKEGQRFCNACGNARS